MVEIIGAPGYLFDPKTDTVWHDGRKLSVSTGNVVQLSFGDKGKRQKKRISLWKIAYAVEHKMNVWQLKDVKVCLTSSGELKTRSDLIKQAVKMRDIGRQNRNRGSQIFNLKQRIGEMQRLLEALESGNFGFVFMDMKGKSGAIANELKRRFGITDDKFIDEIVDAVIYEMLDYIIDRNGYLCGYAEIMKKKAIKVASESLSRKKNTVRLKNNG